MKDIDELSDEERRLAHLVRMSHRREAATPPDVDKAWNDFRRSHVAPSSPRRGYSAGHLVVAALAGAAAMLAVVWLLRPSFPGGEKADASAFVALQHRPAQPQIRLEKDDSTLDLTTADSISFRAPAAPVVASQAAPQQPVRTQRLSTPRGMDFKVILPDGSEVWLNAESTIEFPSAFRDGLRQVRLKGEAYFRVARNEEAPFVVSTDRMNVRVLGTSFNMRNYEHEAPHVALVDGKVEVLSPDGTQPDATLQPGQEAWLDESGTLRVGEADTYAVTQWVKGFFYFHDEPLVDVLRELGRWYNYGVVFHNREAIHQHVHFSALRNEGIEVAVESLNRLRHVYIRIEGNDLAVY